LTTWTNFFAYDVGGNLTNQLDAIGALGPLHLYHQWLVLTSADANGNISRFSYDTNGFFEFPHRPGHEHNFLHAHDVAGNSVKPMRWVIRLLHLQFERQCHAHSGCFGPNF